MTKRIVVNSIMWFLMALFFAAIYATVEGNKPWAANLDTWRPDPSVWWVKLLYWIPCLGREVNGFDTFGLVFLCLFGLVLIPVWEWTHSRPMPIHELLELAVYFTAICVIEDFVWYAINPHFGFAKFDAIHTSGMYNWWLLGFPGQYWEGFLLTLPLSIGSRSLGRQQKRWRWNKQGWKQGLKFFTTVWCTMIMLAVGMDFVAKSWRY